MKKSKIIAVALASVMLAATPIALSQVNTPILSEVTLEASAANKVTGNVTIGNAIYDLYDNSTAVVRTAKAGVTSLTIPKTVTYSGKTYTVTNVLSSAFAKNTTLTTVNMSAATGLKSLGSYAFQNCTKLTKVTLPNQLTEVPSNCFDGCTSLTSCNIPTSAITIGNAAFRNTKLSTVTLPATLKTIGSYAFYNMSALQYVNQSAAVCLPNLTQIGSYAFANCSKLRGNTENGSLTFGAVNLTASSSLWIKDHAFYNCDQIRYLKSRYSKIEVDQYAFSEMSVLSSADFTNTEVKLGKKAFGGDTALANVFIKPSVLSIDNSAFDGTSYYTNKCTAEAIQGRDFGNNKKLVGKQLVVNLFVETLDADTSVNAKGYVKHIGPKTTYTLKNNQCAVKDDTGYTIFENNGVFDYQYKPQWQVSKTNTANQYTAVSLNQADYSKVSVTTKNIDSVTTAGFLGSRVSSNLMTERINAVKAATDDLTNQAKEYGQTVSFVMNADTNFYMTYGTFDTIVSNTQEFYNKQNPNDIKNPLHYDLGFCAMLGYHEPMTQPLDKIGRDFLKDIKNPLFTNLKTRSQKLKSTSADTIDLSIPTYNKDSSYTDYLKRKYQVDGVIYLIHIAYNGGISTTHQHTQYMAKYSDGFSGLTECCFIYLSTGHLSGQPLVEHEICHLFGASDFYVTNKADITPTIDYIQTHYSTDIMMSTPSTTIGPATAFKMGWLDKFDKTTYNTIFSNSKVVN